MTVGLSRKTNDLEGALEEIRGLLGQIAEVNNLFDKTKISQAQLQEFLDEYNKNQPTYRRITGLVIRKNPFIRSTTKKIRRQDVLIDEPQA